MTSPEWAMANAILVANPPPRLTDKAREDAIMKYTGVRS